MFSKLVAKELDFYDLKEEERGFSQEERETRGEIVRPLW